MPTPDAGSLAEQINASTLANNAGFLSQSVPDWAAAFLGDVAESEPVTVGEAPKRRIGREIRKSGNQGRRLTRRYSNLIRRERLRELRMAPRVQRLIERTLNRSDEYKAGTGLLERLTGMANDDLDAGRSLTAGEQRTASQDARAAFSARGLANSDPAAVAEVLNRHQFGEQRYRQRQQFAQGLIGQNLAVTAMSDPFARIPGYGQGKAADAFLPGVQLAQGIQNQDAHAQLAITQQQGSIDANAALQNQLLQHQMNTLLNQQNYDWSSMIANHNYANYIGQLNTNAAEKAAGQATAGQIGGGILSGLGGLLGGGGGFLGGLFS